MKKICLIIVLSLLLSTSICFASTVNITVNNQPVKFTEETGQPFILNNYTLVPMRVVMEQYGCTVTWSQSLQTVTIVKGNSEVKVPISQNYILVNNQKQDIDVPAQVIDGKTYLPIRSVLEGVGATVEWDNNSKSVVVNNQNTVVNNQKNINELVNVNEDSYNEFLSHFDIEVTTDTVNGVYSNTITKNLSIVFKDSNNKDDLIAFLKSIDYTTLQNYTLKIVHQNCLDSDRAGLAYMTSRHTVKDIVFNACNIRIENNQIQNQQTIMWGDIFIKK